MKFIQILEINSQNKRPHSSLMKIGTGAIFQTPWLIEAGIGTCTPSVLIQRRIAPYRNLIC